MAHQKHPASHYKKIIFVLALLLLTIAIFSTQYGHDEGFIDTTFYLDYAKYFRGELEWQSLTAPYSYRPITPFFASLLPWELRFNFAFVNFIFVSLTYLVIYFFLKEFRFTTTECCIGVLLYAISYPMSLYMSIPLSDAGGMFFLFLGVYLIKKQSQWFFVIAPISVLARETNIVLVLIYVFQKNALHIKSVLLILPLIVHYLMRKYFSPIKPFAWIISKFNLVRPEAYFHWLLGPGIVWLFLFFSVKYRKQWFPVWQKNGDLRFIAGCAIPLLGLLAYSWVVTYFDSRYIMMTYPVIIPLSVVGISRYTYTLTKFKKFFTILN